MSDLAQDLHKLQIQYDHLWDEANEIRKERDRLRALSQPAPAVPDAVRQLPEKWRQEMESIRSGTSGGDHDTIRTLTMELECALAAAPKPEESGDD